MKRFFAMMLIVILTFTMGANAFCEEIDWPTKPITLICAHSAGGSSDLMARYLARSLQKVLGVSVVVENHPGSGGWLAWNDLLHNTEPDGYTFNVVNTPSISLGHYDETNPREDRLEDFNLLCNHVSDYNVIAIRNDETRFTDLGSLIEYGKENELLIAVSATNILSDDVNCMQKLISEYGIKVVYVQTEGSKDSETMFISGNTDVMVANIGDTRVASENGEYKVLAVFAPERSNLLPDVPTCEELGFGAIYNASSRGYAFPQGVDQRIYDKMLAALETAINDPECVDALEEMGCQTVFISGQEYMDFLEQETLNSLNAFGIAAD